MKEDVFLCTEKLKRFALLLPAYLDHQVSLP